MTDDKLVCFDCGARVDYRQPGVGQYITGIRQNRTAGGANHIIDMQGTVHWLCRTCTDSHRANAKLNVDALPGLF